MHDYVISLEPEFITPQDGAAKQDCEQAAMLRWLERQVHHFASDSLTALTDDLHSHQPTCLWLREHHYHFIMVCLPDLHPFLYEQVAELTKLNLVSEVVARLWNGRYWERWTYHFVNDLFLRDSADAILVNWCEIIIMCEDTQAIWPQPLGFSLAHGADPDRRSLPADSPRLGRTQDLLR